MSSQATKAKLQAKLAAKSKAEALVAQQVEAAKNKKSQSQSQPTEVTPASSSAAPPEPKTYEELRAIWTRAMKTGDDFRLICRAYMDLFEAQMDGPYLEEKHWQMILDDSKTTLLAFSKLVQSLDRGESTNEEQLDEFVFYRCALILTQVEAATKAKRHQVAVGACRQLLQSLWERFGCGYGLGPRIPKPGQTREQTQNIFIVQPLRMLLSTLCEARMFVQAESVCEAIEQILKEDAELTAKEDADGKGTENVSLELPAILRAETLTPDNPHVLPPFLRQRQYACTDNVKKQAAAMGLQLRGSNDLRLNLRMLVWRCRAMYSTRAPDQSEEDFVKLVANYWLTMINALAKKEEEDIVRCGSYSLDVLLEAAEVMERFNLLSVSAVLNRRLQDFYLPLSNVRSGVAPTPSDLLKISSYDAHLRTVALESKLLKKYADSISLNHVPHSIPLPPSWPDSVADSITRFNQQQTITQTRIQSQGDVDNFLASILSQAKVLAFGFHKPWDGIKKSKEGIALLDKIAASSTHRIDQQLSWRRSLLLGQGSIFCSALSPPQWKAAREAFDASRQVMQQQKQRFEGTGRQVTSVNNAPYLHAIISLLPTESAKLHEELKLTKELVEENLQLIKKEAKNLAALKKFHEMNKSSASASTAAAASSTADTDVLDGMDLDVKKRMECMNELDAFFDGGAADNKEKKLDLLSSLSIAQQNFMRYTHILAVVDRALSLIESKNEDSTIQAEVKLLQRINSDMVEREKLERDEALSKEQVQISSRLSYFTKCASPPCRFFHTSSLPFFSCSQCHKVSYCSKECQKSDWKEHKPYCIKSTDASEAKGNN